MGIELSSHSRGSGQRGEAPSHLTIERRPDWDLVTTQSTDKWKPHVADVWGFDFPIQWRARQLKVQKWPWSKFCVTGRTASGKEEKLCTFTCQVFETGREEKLSIWMKDLSVVGFHPHILVVQVVMSKAVKLLVVDWHQDKLLGTYSFAFSKEPCLQECYISPDGSLMLCRQDFLLRRRLHHVMSLDPNIRVIQIKDGLCRRLFVIQDHLVLGLCGSGISFDPRYPHGRVAVFSSTQQAPISDLEQNDDHADRLAVYDLRTRNVIVSAPSLTDKLIHHMTHSPDGNFIAALGVNASVFLSCHIYLSSIDVYSADTLDRVRHIPLHNELCKMVHLHLYPAFSRNGHLLVQYTGETTRQVEVYQMPCLDRSLQEMCRSVILRCTPRPLLPHLPLPRSMGSFLHFIRH